jgi:hypothetical protein
MAAKNIKTAQCTHPNTTTTPFSPSPLTYLTQHGLLFTARSRLQVTNIDYMPLGQSLRLNGPDPCTAAGLTCLASECPTTQRFAALTHPLVSSATTILLTTAIEPRPWYGLRGTRSGCRCQGCFRRCCRRRHTRLQRGKKLVASEQGGDGNTCYTWPHGLHAVQPAGMPTWAVAVGDTEEEGEGGATRLA